MPYPIDLKKEAKSFVVIEFLLKREGAASVLFTSFPIITLIKSQILLSFSNNDTRNKIKMKL